jgi:hypothetical protein
VRDHRTIVNQLAGPAFKGEPHAIWSTEDQSKLYVGHERGNQVTVIAANGLNDASDDKVLSTISDPFIKRRVVGDAGTQHSSTVGYALRTSPKPQRVRYGLKKVCAAYPTKLRRYCNRSIV